MRKSNRASAASLLSSGDLFISGEAFADFGGNFSSLSLGPGASIALHANNAKDEEKLLDQSFLQLRAILSRTTLEVDSLTLMQPFMLTIVSSSMSGYVTALALNSVVKALEYNIIKPHSPNFATTIIRLTTSLTHCRFEVSDQNTDDSLLMKVLHLLETIVTSPVLSATLPNAVMSEVIHTCLCLACNKRRSEVLRRASEMAMVSITVCVFQRVRELEPDLSKGEDIPAHIAELNSDVIGDEDLALNLDTAETINCLQPSLMHSPPANTIDFSPLSPGKEPAEKLSKLPSEEQFDIQCINEFLGFLISMISPSNQFQHMESTRVFALSLINTALEVSGNVIPQHPSLMALVADPISKDVLQIISSTDLPALLQAALRLFCTMYLILKPHLMSQNELTFISLFLSILPELAPGLQRPSGSVSLKASSSKEIIIEHFSYLWSISPSFFTELFIDFDCDFERSDLASKFVNFLCNLALPESAALTTDNVPPMCLDGIRYFVAGIHEGTKQELNPALARPDDNHKTIIANKLRKKAFIACTELFNNKAAHGVKALYDEGFLKDPSDKKELAQFFYQKSTRLNKKVLGVYLSNPENKDLLREFMHLFDFGGLRVDEGLRIVLKSFRLPGEAQQIERIVETFANSFVALQNSGDGGDILLLQQGDEPVVLDSSAVFLLSYSIIMLNTDLHNPKVKRHMDLNDYERNVSGLHSFPRWYLENIYNSIRDREIVMPEEHHGTEKWFDDEWHNSISSQSIYVRDHTTSSKNLSPQVISRFDKLLFESVVDNILDTLLLIFSGAEDDVIITQVMSSIDKCGQICATYGMSAQVNRLMETLADFTCLAKKNVPSADASPNGHMPTTQIKLQSEHLPITVSRMSIRFGGDYKAQLSFHVLFTLAKNPNARVQKSWDPLIKTILTLFENCLIDPNLFGEFQKLLHLPPLAKVKPQHEPATPKAGDDFGFISTVSSFLRSYSDVPEPSQDEITDTKHTMNIIKLVKVSSVFESVSKRDPAQIELFVQSLLDNLPLPDPESERFYESELLFLFEVAVCFALIVNSQPVISSVIEHLLHHLQQLKLTKDGETRLITYYFLLAGQCDTDQHAAVLGCLENLLKLDPKDLRRLGSPLVLPLISLADSDSPWRDLISSKEFWELLKKIGTEPKKAEEVLSFATSVVEKSPANIKPENFLNILALLDEFSSLGAIYAHVEQGQPVDVAPAEKERMQSLLKVSKVSLDLTSRLGDLYHDQFDSLVQALAHQCFNPCREVRNHAIKLLRTILISSLSKQPARMQVIFDFGLFPLLAELEKDQVLDTDREGFSETQLQVLTLLSKCFLMFHDKIENSASENIWNGIVRSFSVFDKLNSHSRNYKTFKEQSLEDMKNMVLVLQNDFLLRSNADLWNSTWAELDQLFPGLKDEITASAEDPTKEKEKTVELEPTNGVASLAIDTEKANSAAVEAGK